VTAVLLLGFVVLMLAGVPVALAMIVASLMYVMLSGTVPDFVVIHRMYGGIDSFPLLAVPFFILAGNLMNSAGVTNRIYNFALALVGWLKGGLGHVNIVGSMIFAGMSGTAIADAAGLGTIEIKAMKDHGYPIDFSVGVTAASATLGPIIPPSLPFVIYGMMAGVSIGQLFLAGVIPGIVMGLFMMATVSWYAHRRNYGRDASFSWSALSRTFVDAFLAMMTPVILLGGMTFGVFTPTEGAIVASAYALVLAPKDARSTIGSVRIAIDGRTGVPLRVQVFAKGATSPAFQVGYTDISYVAPNPANLTFTPPHGATVTNGDAQSAPGDRGGPAVKGQTGTYGQSWLTVAEVPRALLSNAPQSGAPGATTPAGTGTFGRDSQAAISALLGAAKPVSGAWGSGTLLRTSLVNVLFVGNEMYLGAVDPSVLYAAVGHATPAGSGS